MVHYVVGFLFDDAGNVVLIQKTRPSWQAGFLNGVGGHIEKGESALNAMRREFQEETGAYVWIWHKFVTVTGKGYELHCFSSRAVGKTYVRTTTDEKVDWFKVSTVLKGNKILANLHWLIPMANYKFKLTGTIVHNDPKC